MNRIKKIASDFGSNILTGIILLGILLVVVGVRRNINFVWIGLLILLPFGIWLLVLKLKHDKLDNAADLVKLKLIETGEKVIVDLDKIKIKNNSWNQEFIIGSGKYQRVELRDINYNYIEFEIPYRNQIVKYNLHIDMELTTLKMHFAIKGKTTLYIDPNNTEDNYLDLRFLED